MSNNMNMNEWPRLTEDDFEPNKMRALAQKDKLIDFMRKELGDDDDTLRIIFNSEVLGDLIMERSYQLL